jgi:transcriptional regulator with XRE-family HTH domain
VEGAERDEIVRENRNEGNTISEIDEKVGEDGELSDNQDLPGEASEMPLKLSQLNERELRRVAGQRVKEARERCGLRQIDVVMKMSKYGVFRKNPSWLSSYEDGSHNFTIYTARALGEILNTSAAYLLCVDDTLAYDDEQLELLRAIQLSPPDTIAIVRKLLGV